MGSRFRGNCWRGDDGKDVGAQEGRIFEGGGPWDKRVVRARGVGWVPASARTRRGGGEVCTPILTFPPEGGREGKGEGSCIREDNRGDGMGPRLREAERRRGGLQPSPLKGEGRGKGRVRASSRGGGEGRFAMGQEGDGMGPRIREDTERRRGGLHPHPNLPP